MQKYQRDGVGTGANCKDLTTVYPVSNAKINTSRTVHKQPIDAKKAVYRNRRGVVVWGELK